MAFTQAPAQVWRHAHLALQTFPCAIRLFLQRQRCARRPVGGGGNEGSASAISEAWLFFVFVSLCSSFSRLEGCHGVIAYHFNITI